MRSAYLTIATGFVGFFLQSQTAAAQFNPYAIMGRSQQPGPPLLPPAVSPYLNLTLGSGPLGYQLRALPEWQREAFESSVTQNWPSLGNYGIGSQPPQALGDFPVLGQTGHLSAFGA